MLDNASSIDYNRAVERFILGGLLMLTVRQLATEIQDSWSTSWGVALRAARYYKDLETKATLLQSGLDAGTVQEIIESR